MSGQFKENGKHAFTLVELLLAVTLASFVLTAGGRIAAQTLKTERRVDALLADQAKHGQAFDSLQCDLDARLCNTTNNVKVDLDAHRRPMIEIICLTAEPGDDLHVSRVPAKVTYRLVRSDPESNRLGLLREVSPLVPDSPAATTTIAPDLVELDIEILAGGRGRQSGRWRALSERGIGRDEQLLAIRMSIRRSDDESGLVRTFVLSSQKRDNRRGK